MFQKTERKFCPTKQTIIKIKMNTAIIVYFKAYIILYMYYASCVDDTKKLWINNNIIIFQFMYSSLELIDP